VTHRDLTWIFTEKLKSFRDDAPSISIAIVTTKVGWTAIESRNERNHHPRCAKRVERFRGSFASFTFLRRIESRGLFQLGRAGTFSTNSDFERPGDICSGGAMDMTQMRRPWTDEEVAKLMSMAQKYPSAQIASETGRMPHFTFSRLRPVFDLRQHRRLNPDAAMRDPFRVRLRFADQRCQARLQFGGR
jgi:hypothetical protein